MKQKVNIHTPGVPLLFRLAPVINEIEILVLTGQDGTRLSVLDEFGNPALIERGNVFSRFEDARNALVLIREQDLIRAHEGLLRAKLRLSVAQSMDFVGNDDDDAAE